MPVTKSKHAVLTPQDLHSQTSMIIKTMLLNHSPKQVAELMIYGLKNKNNSDIFISTTGIAGPGGGSKKKPVGTVFHSFYIRKKNIFTIKNFYEGNRYKIRLKASMFAINETFKKLHSIM